MELFGLCKLDQELSKEEYLKRLDSLLRDGISPTITLQDVELAESTGQPLDEVDAGDQGTSLLHQLVNHMTVANSEIGCVLIEKLFEYGANWMMLDLNNDTAGDIAFRKNLLDAFELFVSAGVRAELLLRKLQEFGGDGDYEEEDNDGDREPVHSPADSQSADATEQSTAEAGAEARAGPEANNTVYLKEPLKYDDSTLKTAGNDGVMMDWETPIMKRSAEILCAKKDAVVLNIGFGMGIIDTFIQQHSPAKHYIAEAHPDVLAKMKQEGWYERENVVVLEGPWKESVPKLLSEGQFFDGIYYDTFSEHYADLKELYDTTVGLLQPDGVFSFFNGLGADRVVTYEVYKRIVELDVADYGLQCEYEEMPVQHEDHTWDNVKFNYFKVDKYYLPKITFG